MRTTGKELAIIQRIIHLQRQESTGFLLSEMIDWIYVRMDGPRLLKPKHPHQALAYTLRNLGYKIERRGCSIIRTSALGRGNLGCYEINGDFSSIQIEEPFNG
jgi:hypothetical protein